MLRKVDSVLRYNPGQRTYTIYVYTSLENKFWAESHHFESTIVDTPFDAAWQVAQQIKDHLHSVSEKKM